MSQDLERIKKFEEEKAREIEQLTQKIQQLDRLRDLRKGEFERQAQQMKELFADSLNRLHQAMETAQGPLARQIEEVAQESQAAQEHLVSLIKEANPAALEEEIKSVEARLRQESEKTSFSEAVHKTAGDLSRLRRDLIERLSEKQAQVDRLRQSVEGKTKELEATSRKLEEEKDQMLRDFESSLRSKEALMQGSVRSLEQELSRRQLKLREVAELASAREEWLREQRAQRIEALEKMWQSLQAPAREFEVKIAEEKTFWEEQLKALDGELGALNMKMVTSQAQITAFRAQAEQERGELERAWKARIEERRLEAQREMERILISIRQAHEQSLALAQRVKEEERGHALEIRSLEERSKKRQEEISQSIEEQQLKLDAMRREYESAVAQKCRELEALKVEYEAKILTPAIKAKQEHVAALEERRRELEAKIGGVEEDYRVRRLDAERSIEESEAQIRRLENERRQNARAHQDQMRDLSSQMEALIAPQAEHLGELERAIELKAAQYREEIAELEKRKANYHIEADHERALFESKIEERRRELLGAIDALSGQRESQESRSIKEKRQWEESLELAREQVARLEREIQHQSAAFNEDRKIREEDIRRSKLEHHEQCRRFQERLVEMDRKGQEELARHNEELAKLESLGQHHLEGLQKSWENQELEMEKRKVELLSQLNSLAEAGARERQISGRQQDGLQQQVISLEQMIQDQAKRWGAIFAELEERRQRELNPLEQQVQELELRKNEMEANLRSRLEAITGKIAALRREQSRQMEDFMRSSSEKRHHREEETALLQERLEKLRLEHQEAMQALQSRKFELEESLQLRQRQLQELAESYKKRHERSALELEEQLARHGKALEKGKVSMERLKNQLTSLLGIKTKEMEALTREFKRQEEWQAQRSQEYEEKLETRHGEVRSELKALLSSKDGEAAQLKIEIEELQRKIKDSALEVEVLRSQREMEQTAAGSSSAQHLEVKISRAQMAQDLRQLRRQFQERLRQKDHELYLIRLKVELRSKSLQEALSRKKKEFELLAGEEFGGQRQSLAQLQARIEKLVESRSALQERFGSLDQERRRLSGEITDLRGQSNFSEPSQADRRRLREAAHKAAQEKLDQLKRRFEEKLAVQDVEKQRLLDLMVKVEPVSEQISISLTDFLLSWEQEMREVAGFIKGLEESNFWRQH
ncbi:MAG: hypothetical protein HY547_07845 [Elusimicrobia bacterium]|nr:hypothetical protein [Elusimicrobiota bacterium]